MHLRCGPFAPVPTPLDDRGRFDAHALGRHLRWLADEDLEGALILGSNGEFPSFSMDERRKIARAAGEARGSLRLILNAGSCSLPEALELTVLAGDCGYDAVVCPPPWYFRNAGDAGVAAFLRAVLDSAALPVLLYHIPQFTGVPISDGLLAALGQQSGPAGVKDSTGDPAEMARLIGHFAKGAYLTGNDRMVHACAKAGGHGSISACASVAPKLVREAAGAADAQQRLNVLRDLLEEFGLGAAVKAVLRSRGFGAFAARPPLLALTPERERVLLARLNALGAAV
jgi:4-hydroxy-tetrahydrodipicolinate synthase